jgi:predicted nucleotidyltransferase
MFWRELKRQLPVDVVVDIEEFTERVREMCPDAKVYLYGSFAKGTWLRDSDVDLVAKYQSVLKTPSSRRDTQYLENLPVIRDPLRSSHTRQKSLEKP